MLLLGALAAGLLACGSFGASDDPAPLPGPDAGEGDATQIPDPVDADRPDSDPGSIPEDAGASPACDLVKPFSAPSLLSINTADYDNGGRLTADELTIYFQRRSGATAGDGDIYAATRVNKQTAFGPAMKIAELNGSGPDGHLTTTASGLLGFFGSLRSGSVGIDLFRTVRADAAAMWGPPSRLGTPSSPSADEDPFVLADGRALYFDSHRSGGGDIFRAAIDLAGSVSAAVPVSGINTSAAESEPVVTLDERTIYFQRTNSIYVATRASVLAPWGTAVPVTELNSPEPSAPDWISADGCRIVLSSDRNGVGLRDIYFAEKPP